MELRKKKIREAMFYICLNGLSHPNNPDAPMFPSPTPLTFKSMVPVLFSPNLCIRLDPLALHNRIFLCHSTHYHFYPDPPFIPSTVSAKCQIGGPVIGSSSLIKNLLVKDGYRNLQSYETSRQDYNILSNQYYGISKSLIVFSYTSGPVQNVLKFGTISKPFQLLILH